MDTNEKFMFEKILHIFKDSMIGTKQNIKQLEDSIYELEQDFALNRRMLTDIHEVFIKKESYYDRYDREEEDITDCVQKVIKILQYRDKEMVNLLAINAERLEKANEQKKIIEFLELKIQKA